jgi:hypothetical protein
MTNLLKRKITKDQSRDTGMAMVLLMLILFVSRKREGWLFVAIALHVLNMIVPQIYRPIAVVWLGFSDLLGMVMPKVLMGIVFFAVVTPIGLVRRLFGKDSLKLKAFKASDESVMLERKHLFIGQDLERPY